MHQGRINAPPTGRTIVGAAFMPPLWRVYRKNQGRMNAPPTGRIIVGAAFMPPWVRYIMPPWILRAAGIL